MTAGAGFHGCGCRLPQKTPGLPVAFPRQDILIAHADDIDEDLFLTVDAQIVEDTANTVYYALREIATGIPAPSLSSTTIIKNVNHAALNAPKFIANMSAPYLIFKFCWMLKAFLSGPAVGKGPPQSVWAKIVEKIVLKESHWARIGEEFFSPLNLATQFVTPSNICEFKTYGLILHQSFFWGFHAYPISPRE